ncbi:YjbH domain-containing protein [Vannielia litorea]|uniref:YjbH domain-containing protein n=1 Tax=Vannielia litorea TaxID=1217970 RepID=UPI0028F717C6|nr:YjbH domain-containing protein [Vannielia litorea]
MARIKSWAGVSAVALVAGLVAGAGPRATKADPQITDSLTLFGTPGILSMPSAEALEDGQISATLTSMGGQTRASFSFQLAPRITGSFRYSRIEDYYMDGEPLSDRSFDLKFQVLQEQPGKWWPAVAVGFQDFLGSGIYSGEYIVATKTVSPRLRFSAGLGWGGLARYGVIGSAGEREPYIPGDEGGTVNASSWFQGDVAAFGGLAFQASDRLTLKAEYSTAGYVDEAGDDLIDRKSPWNFGLDYKIRENAHLQAAYIGGSEVAVQLSFSTNPRKPAVGPGNETAPLPVAGRPARRSDPGAWDTAWASDPATKPGLRRVLGNAMAKEGLILEAMAYSGRSIELRYRNTRYIAEPQAMGRISRILTRALPASVETFSLVPVQNGVPGARVTLKRSDLEAFEHAGSAPVLAAAQITDTAAAPDPAGLEYLPGQYPRFTWSLSPYVALTAFDPESPLRGDVGLRLSGRYDLAPGWVLEGAITKKVFGNGGEDENPSTSVLPHVRSDAALYAAEGDPAIERLTLAYYGRPGPNLYSRLTVGMLESMFGGVSGELLWKPVDSRLALGGELNWVKQRDYDQLFSFREYEVVTGHVSAYYDFGNGYHGTLDVGRYLAGDWGATVALDREFDNGWRIGAYATVTDVSAEDFGEGSFDKGIRVTVPYSFFTGQPSKKTAGTTLRSLARDGGAKLSVNGRLYDTVRDTHRPELEDRWGRFWR